MLAHCSPSSEWVPGCNTRVMRVARRGTGNWQRYLTCQSLRISTLSNRHYPTYKSIWDYLFFTSPRGNSTCLVCHPSPESQFPFKRMHRGGPSWCMRSRDYRPMEKFKPFELLNQLFCYLNTLLSFIFVSAFFP